MFPAQVHLVSWFSLVTKAKLFFTHNANTAALYIKGTKAPIADVHQVRNYRSCQFVILFDLDIEDVDLGKK